MYPNKQFYFKQFSLTVFCLHTVKVVFGLHTVKYQFFVYTQLNIKTVLFRTIQFNISAQFSSIWPTDKTSSVATTPGQSGPGSDRNKEALHITQSSRIDGASPSDSLVSYAGYFLGMSQQRCSWYILQSQLTGPGLIRLFITVW